jgi:hypothetical protein
VIEFLHQRGPPCQERLAGFGQGQFPGRTLKQANAELRFQRRDDETKDGSTFESRATAAKLRR